METHQRHKENPFLEGMIVPVKGKQIRLSILGKEDDILLQQSTGEIKGTHLVTYKKVDGEKFIKLFTSNVSLAFDLTSAGIKAFTVLMWAVQKISIERDQVEMGKETLQKFLDEHEANETPLLMGRSTFTRGIYELENAQIIAKTEWRGKYFLNPNFIFNGNRIAFTTLIERKQGAT